MTPASDDKNPWLVLLKDYDGKPRMFQIDEAVDRNDAFQQAVKIYRDHEVEDPTAKCSLLRTWRGRIEEEVYN